MHIYPKLNATGITLLSEESAAAIKIQARFRGYRVRKQLKRYAQGRRNSGIITARRLNNHNGNSIRRQQHQQQRQQLQQQQQQQRQQLQQQQQQQQQKSPLIHYLRTNCKESGISMPVMDCSVMATAADQQHYPETDSVENRCATKIQAGVRGYLVRKKQKQEADAATKIQAGFRGFKARKELQLMREK